MKKIKLVVTALILSVVSGQFLAQNLQITQNHPNALVACGADSLFEIVLVNIGTSVLNELELLPTFPSLGVFYTGTVTGASEIVNDANAPVFYIPSLDAGDSVKIRYSLSASCDVITDYEANSSLFVNQLKVNYNGGNETDSQLSSYNVFFAELNIQSVLIPGVETGKLGEYKQGPLAFSNGYRRIKIVNGGSGALDTITIRIIPEDEIEYFKFNGSISGNSVPFTQIGNEIVIKLFGTTLTDVCSNTGINDLLFEENEEITMDENFQIISCSPNGQTKYFVDWGCYGKVCNENDNAAEKDQNINVVDNAPDITITKGPIDQLANQCGKDGEIKFYVVNTAATSNDFATNLSLDYLFGQNQSGVAGTVFPSDFTIYDLSIDGYLVDTTSFTTLVTTTSIPVLTTINKMPGYIIDFSKNKNPLISKKLRDIDNDGFYDDLTKGDTLILTARVKMNGLSQDCPLNFGHTYGRPQVKFSNACGTVTEYKNFNNILINSGLNSRNEPDLITAPTDMFEDKAEKFTFCTSKMSQNLQFFDCTVDSSTALVFLPKGYYMFGDSASWKQYNVTDSLKVPVKKFGDTLVLELGNTLFGLNNWNGCLSLDLGMQCISATDTIGGTSVVSWELNYKCADCDSIQRRFCDNVTVVNHCPGCIVEGITTTGFSAYRTSLGWTDYTRTTYVDPLNPAIKLNAAYAYDTVHTVTTGFVNSTAFDQLFARIEYNSPAELFDWVEGTITVYDASGNIVMLCPSPAPQLNKVGTMYYLDFLLGNTSNSPCLALLNSDYTISLENDWTVKAGIQEQIIKVLPFRSGFYMDTSGYYYSCVDFGTPFTYYGTNTYFSVTQNNLASGCESTQIGLQLQSVGGLNAEDFPNEFRNIVELKDTIKFIMPYGYSYEQGSATTIEVAGIIDGLATFNRIPINDVTVSGDTIIFVYDWILVDEARSDYVIGARQYLRFNLLPNCERANTVTGALLFDYDYYMYSVVDSLHESRSNLTRDWQPATKSNVSFSNYLPNLTLVNFSPKVQDALTREVEWAIQVCNLADQTHSFSELGVADSVWLDIQQLANGIGDVVINEVIEMPSNTSLYMEKYENAAGDSSVFIKLGTVKRNGCRTIRIKANYTGCRVNTRDSLQVKTGWNCQEYPTPLELDTAICHVDTAELYVRYQTANLQVKVDSPAKNYNRCDTIPFTVTLSSTGAAFMYDLDLWVNLPEGTSITNAKYRHPLMSNWQDLTTYNSGFQGPMPQSGWHLSQDLPSLAPYEGGLVGTVDTTHNKILVYFDLVSSCDFNILEGITITARGITNCNDSIVRPNMRHITFNGFTNLDDLNITISAPDSTQCNTSDTLIIDVTNNKATPSQVGDSIRAYIPNEFVILNSPLGSVVSSNSITWPLSPVLAGNENISYQIVITTADTSDCATYTFPVEILYSGESSCGNEMCPFNLVLKSDTDSMVVCCDRCNIVSDFYSDTVCIGDTTCFRLADQTTIGADYLHWWRFGDGATSTEAEPCHLYALPDTYTVTHTVLEISTGCTDSVTHQVKVWEKPHGVIELLGCNPFCEGDTVYLTVNGHYERIEWIKYGTPSQVVGTTDTLTVTTSGTYTALLYNGLCVDSCLAIKLTQLPPPEIEIPDTMFCRGDSVYVCAAGGYTSYEWALNGVVFNTTDTCVWISKEGVYTVRVGEKTPYGCCSCYGIDTFIVRINDLHVEVPDIHFCIDASDTLCAKVTGGVPAYSYLWSPNGETTPCIIVNSAGTYTATVTDQMGCVAVDSGVVTIDSIPCADFIYDDTICVGEEYCFVPLCEGDDYWELSNVNNTVLATSTDNIFCYTFDVAGRYEVLHIVTNECGADTVIHWIEVVPPVETCIVMIGTNPFCVGDSVYLTINDPNGWITNVEWYWNDVYYATGRGIWVKNGGKYASRVFDLHGCVSECICIILTQNPKPVIDLPTEVHICPNKPLTLEAGAGFASYNWYKDSIPFSFGVSSIAVNQPGVYSVEVTDSNGCKATDSTIVRDPLTMTLNTTQITVCSDESFTLSTLCDPNLNYVWRKRIAQNNIKPTVISGATNCNLVRNYNDLSEAAVGTEFIVHVTDTRTGCTFTQSKLIFRDICFGLSLFPNPTVDNSVQAYYDLVGQGIRSAEIQFRDIQGDAVLTYGIDPEVQTAALDLTDLANGVYFVSLIANGVTIETEKLVIAR